MSEKISWQLTTFHWVPFYFNGFKSIMQEPDSCHSQSLFHIHTCSWGTDLQHVARVYGIAWNGCMPWYICSYEKYTDNENFMICLQDKNIIFCCKLDSEKAHNASRSNLPQSVFAIGIQRCVQTFAMHYKTLCWVISIVQHTKGM